MARSFLAKVMAISLGYFLSLIGVMLPWRARNKYLDFLGCLIGTMLHSKMVIDFFMNIGFRDHQTNGEGKIEAI